MIRVPKTRQDVRRDWDMLFESNRGYICNLIESQLRIILDNLNREFNGCYNNVKLVVHPSTSKNVIARQDIAKGELMFVPITSDVSCVCTPPEDDKNLRLGELYIDEDFTVYGSLSPTHTLYDSGEAESSHRKKPEVFEFVAPFWCVQPTGASSNANMTFKVLTIKVEGNGPASGVYYIPCLTNTKDVTRGDVLLSMATDSHKGHYPTPGSIPTAKRAHTR